MRAKILVTVEVEVPLTMLRQLNVQARRRDIDLPSLMLVFLGNELRRQVNSLKGRQVAAKQGIRFGRPPSLTTAQIAEAKTLKREGAPLRVIAARLGVSSATISRTVG